MTMSNDNQPTSSSEQTWLNTSDNDSNPIPTTSSNASTTSGSRSASSNTTRSGSINSASTTPSTGGSSSSSTNNSSSFKTGPNRNNKFTGASFGNGLNAQSATASKINRPTIQQRRASSFQQNHNHNNSRYHNNTEDYRYDASTSTSANSFPMTFDPRYSPSQSEQLSQQQWLSNSNANANDGPSTQQQGRSHGGNELSRSSSFSGSSNSSKFGGVTTIRGGGALSTSAQEVDSRYPNSEIGNNFRQFQDNNISTYSTNNDNEAATTQNMNDFSTDLAPYYHPAANHNLDLGSSNNPNKPPEKRVSFVQQFQPPDYVQRRHVQTLGDAVESSRYNWPHVESAQQSDSTFGGYNGTSESNSSSSTTYDSPYFGANLHYPHGSESTSFFSESSAPSSSSSKINKSADPSSFSSDTASATASGNKLGWNRAINVAMRPDNEMTIGDLLKLSGQSISEGDQSASSAPSTSRSQYSSFSAGGEPSDVAMGGSEVSISPQQFDDEAHLEPNGVAPKIKPFISKLEYLLSHPQEFKDCLVWDDSGKSFIICHAEPRLLKDVLPRFYQHSNIHSFTRQLNVYGFNRLSPSELISRLDIASVNDYSGWRHPLFTRDDKSRLQELTPKPSRARAQKKVEKQEAQAQARTEAEFYRQQKQMQQFQQKFGSMQGLDSAAYNTNEFRSYGMDQSVSSTTDNNNHNTNLQQLPNNQFYSDQGKGLGGAVTGGPGQQLQQQQQAPSNLAYTTYATFTAQQDTGTNDNA